MVQKFFVVKDTDNDTLVNCKYKKFSPYGLAILNVLIKNNYALNPIWNKKIKEVPQILQIEDGSSAFPLVDELENGLSESFQISSTP